MLCRIYGSQKIILSFWDKTFSQQNLPLPVLVVDYLPYGTLLHHKHLYKLLDYIE
jgi:UDP:flavonoid glycosyltransferase YjiC (YdhE family)